MASEFPRRTRVCLDCRTALPGRSSCTWLIHRVVDLERPGGRDALVARVWGADALGRRRRHSDDPLGATAAPLRPRRPIAVTGTVEPGETAPAPLTRTACVAFAVELTREGARGTALILRDSVTLGFTVRVDGGGRIAVARGPIDLIAEPRTVRRRAAVNAYLAGLDRAAGGGSHPPFPWERAAEACLRPDDRVAVLSDLDLVIDTAAGARAGPLRGYRDTAPAVHVPRGLAIVELLAGRPR